MNSSKSLPITRREFLKLTALIAGSTILGKYGINNFVRGKPEQLSSELEYVANICQMCSTACDIVVATKKVNGRRIAIKIEGDPNSGYNMGKICARGQSGLRRQYSPNRIKKPLIREDPNTKGTWNFKLATWDEALSFIKNKIQELTGGDISKVALVGGWVGCVNYRPFMIPLLKRPIDEVGIGWIVGVPLQHCVFGAGLGIDLTVGVFNCHAEIMADFENSDYILIARANSSVAGVSIPRGVRLAAAKKNGAKIVVLDPRFSETAALATEWIKIKPGTDPAFLLAMINVIISEGYYDEEYLKMHTNMPFLAYEPTADDPVPQLVTDDNGNFLVYDNITKSIVAVPKYSNSNAKDINNNPIEPALEVSGLTYNGKTVKTIFQYFKERVSQYTPEWAESICDVPAEVIRRIAREFGSAKRPTIDPSWYGGRYENSFMFSKLRAILMALKGMIDKKGGWVWTGVGRLPLMKWNSSGAPRMAPSLPGFLPVYGMLKMMAWPNADKVPAMFPAMSDVVFHAKVKAGDIKVVIIAGSNPLVSMYDKAKWGESLKNTFVIVLDVKVSDTMLYADVVLPELNYLERDEIVKPSEAFDIELVTRNPAADPPEGAEPKHYLTITGYLLDIFDQISGKNMKDLWFEKLKGLFGLSDEEKAVFDEIVDRTDNENLPVNLKRFFAWLFTSRLKLCVKLGLSGLECTREQLINRILEKLKEGPIEAITLDEAIENYNVSRKLQLSTPSGRVEIFSTIMYEAYQIFKNRFGYNPAWDPLIAWPNVMWKDGVEPNWKPSGNEFFVTHGKVSLMSFTSTTNNDLLLSLAALEPRYFWVWINTKRAKELGIKTGDLIKITETKTNKSVYARAYVTDLIREDTIFIPSTFKGEFGEEIYYSEFYKKFGPFVNFTELIPYQPDKICTAYRSNEFTVKVEKA